MQAQPNRTTETDIDPGFRILEWSQELPTKRVTHRKERIMRDLKPVLSALRDRPHTWAKIGEYDKAGRASTRAKLLTGYYDGMRYVFASRGTGLWAMYVPPLEPIAEDVRPD